jgi:hypothetical protein
MGNAKKELAILAKCPLDHLQQIDSPTVEAAKPAFSFRPDTTTL